MIDSAGKKLVRKRLVIFPQACGTLKSGKQYFLPVDFTDDNVAAVLLKSGREESGHWRFLRLDHVNSELVDGSKTYPLGKRASIIFGGGRVDCDTVLDGVRKHIKIDLRREAAGCIIHDSPAQNSAVNFKRHRQWDLN